MIWSQYSDIKYSVNGLILHLMYSDMLFYCILTNFTQKTTQKHHLSYITKHPSFLFDVSENQQPRKKERLWWLGDGASIVCHTTASICTARWCGCLLAPAPIGFPWKFWIGGKASNKRNTLDVLKLFF